MVIIFLQLLARAPVPRSLVKIVVAAPDRGRSGCASALLITRGKYAKTVSGILSYDLILCGRYGQDKMHR